MLIRKAVSTNTTKRGRGGADTYESICIHMHIRVYAYLSMCVLRWYVIRRVVSTSTSKRVVVYSLHVDIV